MHQRRETEDEQHEQAFVIHEKLVDGSLVVVTSLLHVAHQFLAAQGALIRAYIDGVLRFGIPPKFFMGVVMPKKGNEKRILNDMTTVLAEKGLEEMYGERN